VIHAREVAKGSNDATQFMNALDRRAVLLTQNVTDFKLLHLAWRLWSTRWATADRHFGIIALPTTGKRWRAPEWREEIGWLLANKQPFDNEMLEWRSSEGWRQVTS